MKMKIRSIFLWPKDIKLTVRSIDLDPDKISVISGWSQTGKSALIPIIDYCLGSNKCTIGIIREKTEWFGLLIELENTEILLARPEPGLKEQISEMHMTESVKIDEIKRPSKNCNVMVVKNRLNDLAGLPSLDFTGEELSSTFASRPSIRDMSAFEFQPQHIVANPYTLFFKADTYEHREKLKTIFPFVLGAIDNRYLALKRELKDLEKVLFTKRKKYENRKLAMNAWLGEIRGLYSQAQEFGLMPKSPISQNEWIPENYLRYLKEVPKYVTTIEVLNIDKGGTERAVKELTMLQKEEREISHEITINRLQLSKIEELSNSSSTYEDALNVQNERMESINWFADKIKNEAVCPFCQSTHRTAHEEVTKLIAMAKQISKSSSAVQESKAVFDKECADIRKRIRNLEDQLNTVRTHRKSLEIKSDEMSKKRQLLSEVYRFVGRLEQSLKNLEFVADESDLVEEIKKLEERISEIRTEINPNLVESKITYALQKISKSISFYAEILEVERPEDLVKLDIVNLTVKVISPEGRADFLWEIGSGANWMGYHLATLLALHEHFISLKSSAVPEFLVIDQPSQVFFPEKWPNDLDPNLKDEGSSTAESDDIRRVFKIFKALEASYERTQNRLQIFVVDHAPEEVWQGIATVKLLESWRHCNALIPKEWLEN